MPPPPFSLLLLSNIMLQKMKQENSGKVTRIPVLNQSVKTAKLHLQVDNGLKLRRPLATSLRIKGEIQKNVQMLTQSVLSLKPFNQPNYKNNQITRFSSHKQIGYSETCFSFFKCGEEQEIKGPITQSTNFYVENSKNS